MRYSYPNANVLLIADVAIHDDSRYEYQWDINYTEKDIETVYGYKIYYSFKELGVKDIKLTVTDKKLGLSSVYTDQIYIRQRNFLTAGQFANGFDVSGIIWTAVRNGQFGEGVQDFISNTINLGPPGTSSLAVYTYLGNQANPLAVANKTFACYMYGQPGSGISVNGYTEVSFDETGTVLPLTDSTNPDGYNISLLFSVDYNSDVCGLYADIYELVNGNEIDTVNGLGVYLGDIYLNGGGLADIRTIPSTGVNYSFSTLYTWYGKASYSFYIALASSYWYITTHPQGTLTKNTPGQQTTGSFDVLNIQQELTTVINYENYYYVAVVTETQNVNNSVPTGVSVVNYKLTVSKGSFPQSIVNLAVLQLSRNLITTPYDEDITFANVNDYRVFQVAKEVGKKVRITVTGLNDHTIWYDFMLNMAIIHESGLLFNVLNDQYYATTLTYTYDTTEPNNTNEIAFVLNSSSYHPTYTCHLHVEQV